MRDYDADSQFEDNFLQLKLHIGDDNRITFNNSLEDVHHELVKMIDEIVK